MGPFKQTTVVIAGISTATGLTVLNQLLNNRLSMKPVIGGFIVGTALLMVAFFSTDIAAALALLMLTTSVLANANPILAKVMG